jgi:hypothetical protein
LDSGAGRWIRARGGGFRHGAVDSNTLRHVAVDSEVDSGTERQIQGVVDSGTERWIQTQIVGFRVGFRRRAVDSGTGW